MANGAANPKAMWFCASSNESKQACAVVGYGHKGYFFGGFTAVQNEPDMQCSVLDMKRMVWLDPDIEGVTPDRTGMECVAFGSVVYLFGGESIGLREVLDDLYELDLEKPGANWVRKFKIEKEKPKARATNTFGDDDGMGAPARARGGPSLWPSARRWYSAARCSKNCFMMFGGIGANGKMLKDTWIFDRKSGMWSRPKCKGKTPCARAYHKAVFLPKSGSVVVFGGFDGNKRLNDINIYNQASVMWSQPAVTGVPPAPRCWHTMVRFKDPAEAPDENERGVEDAGTSPAPKRSAGGDPAGEDEEKEDGGSEPSEAVEVSGTDDPTRVLIFGGASDDGLADANLYTWQRSTGAWETVEALGQSPDPRFGHMCMSVPGMHRTVIYGGFDGEERTDECFVLSTDKEEVLKETNRASGYGTVKYPDGSVYEGFFKSGTKNTRHGKGKLIYPDGSNYTGDFIDGERTGQGLMKFADNSKYEGTWERDHITGMGCYTYASPAAAGNLGRKVWLQVCEGEFWQGQRAGGARADYSDGSVYFGNFVNGERHGDGTIEWKGGRKYEGLWENDKRVGTGYEKTAQNDRYTGQFDVDVRQGKGVCVYGNGDKYEGSWKADKRNGVGKCVYANNDVYLGKWIKDKRSGKGECKYGNGHAYNGMWEDDNCAGLGVCLYVNGDQYTGEWMNGQRNGKGKLVRANGDIFEGNWKGNRRAGQGECKYGNGDVYVGNWGMGMREGKGTLTQADGGVYVGEFQKDKMHGKGQFTCVDGDVYQGSWANGMRHGTGVQKYKEPSVVGGEDDAYGRIVEYSGDWKNNMRHGMGKCVSHDGDTFECPWKKDRKVRQAVTFS